MENGSRDKWALLVGIDRYPGFGSDVQLEGCVNDVQIMRDALVRRFDFTDERMTVLLNEQATRDGILGAMEDLVRKVGEDDIVVFHFSGHGSQLHEKEGEEDEPDGWDETLVPFDSGRFPRKNRDITDDEIYDWLQRLTARTPFVTLIIDSCHSGTVVRNAFGGRMRRVPPEEHKPLAARPSETLYRGARRVLFKDGPSGWLPQSEKYTLIAACASTETASEILVGEPRCIAHGALTYFVVQELMNPDFTGGTYLELLERLAPRIKARSLAQNPQVEGARDREIFGTRDVRPMRFISVRSRGGDMVVLDGGSACGLTMGSEWVVYAQGTRSPEDAPPLGKVSVIAVRGACSEARILEERRAFEIKAGDRAVETVHCLEKAHLKVEIRVPPAQRHAVEDLRLEIQRSKFLTEAPPGEQADARVYLLGGRGWGRGQVSEPVLGPVLNGVQEETWAAVLADGISLVGPAVRRGQSAALEILRQNLENAARLRGLASLRNDGSPLRGKVGLGIHRLVEGRCLPPELDGNNNEVFTEGDQVVLEIRNQSTRPLYFYILDIGLTGRVGLVYPPEGSCECLESGSTFYVGKGERALPPLFIPPDFELLYSQGEKGELVGRETLKLFVTTSPANFRILFNDGFRFRTGVAQSLNEFLEATFGGGGYGAYRTADEDWTTVEKSFLLRGRREDEAVV